MAPQKSEQAGGREQSPNIHHLPVELLHMICRCLKPVDIAGMRLLDRNIATVGLEYLVSQIHLIPKAESFDRLLAIAENPIASQYVTSLFYEADLLSPHYPRPLDRKDWEKSIVAPEYAGPLEEVQDPFFASACERLPRRYIRGPRTSVSGRRHNYTERELQQAYERYRKNLAEQNRMNESAIYQEALVSAMKRLPRLTSFITSCERGNSDHFRAAFEDGLSENVTPDRGNYDHYNSGALQLGFLLSAADKADLRITKLVSGSLGQCCRLAYIERDDFMTRSVRNLRALHLLLSHESRASGPGAAVNVFGANEEQFGYPPFMVSAPDLETLSIEYNEIRRNNPPDLKHFLRRFHWPYLTSVTFAKMSTSYMTLNDFCIRHASTLKEFCLKDIDLHGGLWVSMFTQMRHRLELDKIDLAGSFQIHAGHFWSLGGEDKKTTALIERYILHKDTKPRDLPFSKVDSLR